MTAPILVFGHDGQVATCLRELAAEHGIELIALGRGEADLLDEASAARAIDANGPCCVINAAAYTAVDKAEEEEDAALALNARAPGAMAIACREAGIPLLHISTDYVFDGSTSGARREDDPVAPLGAYGRTKLAGEEAVREAGVRHLILRTAWVYSEHGSNFMKTMLRLGTERDTLGIVADQHGTPTYARDIAAALLDLNAAMTEPARTGGTYHMTAASKTTWHGFAEAIFAEAATRGWPISASIDAIATSDFPTPAARPANSVLDCSALTRDFGITLPHWRDGLARAMARFETLRV